MKIWRYNIGRNVVVITEDGFLFAKTEWGDYVHVFASPGIQNFGGGHQVDFRSFFLDIKGDYENPQLWSHKARYLVGALVCGKPDVSEYMTSRFVVDVLGALSRGIKADLEAEAAMASVGHGVAQGVRSMDSIREK